MKKIVLIAVGATAFVLLFVAAIALQLRSERPDILMRKLLKARGEARDALIMKIGLSREDTVPAMIRAFQRPETEPELRVVLLELLFKKFHRTSDDRVAAVLQEALRDDDDAVRREAVRGYTIFGSREDQTTLASMVDDPSPEVRRQVYALLTADRHAESGPWAMLDDALRKQIAAKVQRQADGESDPELNAMARSVIGREIALRCHKATELLQTADAAGAEALLKSALALDPGSHYARIRLVRHHLAAGNRDKALALAESFGALIRIPRLTSAPVVDGDPEETAWDEAFTSENSYLNTSRWIAMDAEGKTRTSIGHLDGRIFIAVRGYEENLDKLVVRHTARDSAVWKDDSVEIMLDPGATESKCYKFAINAAGALDDGCRGGPRREYRRNFACEYAAGIFHARGYWSCEFSVAAAELDDQQLTGDSVWGLNIVRTRIGPASECCSLWPTYGSNLRMDLFPIAVFKMQQTRKATPKEREAEDELRDTAR